jgi:hypothetical protein
MIKTFPYRLHVNSCFVLVVYKYRNGIELVVFLNDICSDLIKYGITHKHPEETLESKPLYEYDILVDRRAVGAISIPDSYSENPGLKYWPRDLLF